MKASQKCIDLIKHYEGFRGKPYYCSANVLTIGYGHAIKKGESYTELTQAQGEHLLIKDIAIFEACVNSAVKAPLTQSQFDALVSFAFNLGCARLKSSTLLRLINLGQYEQAANEFERWAKERRMNGTTVYTVSNGLLARRYSERDLFQGKGLFFYEVRDA